MRLEGEWANLLPRQEGGRAVGRGQCGLERANHEHLHFSRTTGSQARKERGRKGTAALCCVASRCTMNLHQ